jgi:type III secretory pathway component EscS
MRQTHKVWVSGVIMVALAVVGVLASLVTLFTDRNESPLATTMLGLLLAAVVIFRYAGWTRSSAKRQP